MKIKILKNGPYIVTGGVPLYEKIIVPVGDHYVLQDGRALPQKEKYILCRCGETSSPPFCDGKHLKNGFDGSEKASRKKYDERAEILKGPDLDLMDDGRCAMARFCHRDRGDAWELTERSYNPTNKSEAIIGATECPAGRLVAIEKNGFKHELKYEPSIEIVQDPEKGVSAAIFVRGGIQIESEDGHIYETQNSVALCRCGKSKNIPFCDASHLISMFDDGYVPKN